jgi:hypothetical protein
LAIDRRPELRRIQRIIAFSLIPLVVVIFFTGKMGTDPESIRDLARNRLREYFPQSTINESATEFEIVESDGKRHVMDFASVLDICKEKPRSCASALDNAMIAAVEGRKPPAARPGGSSSAGVPKD